MRNLINFIANYHATFLFVLLELMGFGLLVTFNNYHNIRFLSGTAEVSGDLYTAVNNITEYINLKETNASLAAENAALREMLETSYTSKDKTFLPLVDTTLDRKYAYMPAKVIQSTVNKRNNYLILNKGTSSGIQQGMGVLEGDNAVGIVTETSAHYATVMPVFHGRAKWSGRLKNQEFFGLVTWDGYDPRLVQLNDIPTHVSVNSGDSVVTRGGGGVFPEGMLIGTVASMEEDPSTGFYVIQLTPATDLRKLQYVYVVENQFQEEIEALETEAEELP